MKLLLMFMVSLMLCGCASDGFNESENTTAAAELSQKSIGWGIKKIKASSPEVPADLSGMLKRYDAFFMDDSGEKSLYLTFDEGYENGYTSGILDILKEQKVPAAFFVTGSYFDREEELVKRMVEDGHIVGNHTQNHPNLSKLTDEKIIEELKVLDDKFFGKYGKHMTYMRPPEGVFSERVLKVAKENGYKTAFWSFAYKDWLKDETIGAQAAFERIAPYLHDGCVLLLHAVSKDNLEVLPRLITYAKEQGYVFKSLDEIVVDKAPEDMIN